MDEGALRAARPALPEIIRDRNNQDILALGICLTKSSRERARQTTSFSQTNNGDTKRTNKAIYLSDTLNFNCKNTTMSDIAHYHKIVISLSETIRLMAEIDEVIETHGGWLGAFQTPSA